MRSSCVLVLLCALLAACGGSLTPLATAVLPTFEPLSPAKTSNAPTLTAEPRSTQSALSGAEQTFPTAAPSSAAPGTTPTGLSPVSTSPPTRTRAPESPSVLSRFNLNELPGEGRGPVALALLGETLYVANRQSSNLAVVKDDKVTSYISLDAGPSAVIADVARNRIYAASYATPTLYLIENDQVVKQVTAGGRVNALALHGENLYVALDNDAIIERYDAGTLTKVDQLKLSQGFGVGALEVDVPRNRLYAGEYGQIVGIDLANFKELFAFAAPYLYGGFAINPSDGSIWSGAYDSDSSRAYVVGYKPDGQELARLFLGSDLQAAAFDDANRLYVLDKFNNQVHVIQTPQAQLIATIPVNESPSDALFDPMRQIVTVANSDNDNLSVIDPARRSVILTVPLANTITALVSNPLRKRVYAANASTNTVYAIEGSRIVGQARTGNAPVDLAVDPETGRLYVASRADGLVTMIDENSMQITASKYITRFLSTVAVDSTNHMLFAGGYSLDPTSLEPEQVFFTQGLTLNSQTTPQYERPNPALKILYALASNGVPGSNSRLTLFRFLYQDLSTSKLLGSKNGGNTTAIAIDPSTNNLFATNTHPLAYTSGLDVFDAQDNLVRSIPMSSRTNSLVVNPETHHLFLSHAQTYQPYPTAQPPPENVVEIIDTNSLGTVAALPVPNEPTRMTLLGDTIYVSSYRDGSMTLIGDLKTVQPPAPTPTVTPTLYPTWTLTPVISPQKTAVPIATKTAESSSKACTIQIAEELRPKAETVGQDKLGCPTGNPVTSDKFAIQAFATGLMVDDFRDENAKRVSALFADHTYRVFPDTWREGDPEEPCANVAAEPARVRPIRGFASVWCTNPRVQTLGVGLDRERSVAVTLQPFERGMIWYLPDVGMFALMSDGTWE